MIIYTDFNLNVLLQFFLSLSKQITFFSPILTKNNLPLKILWKYYENIVIVFLNFNFLFFILCFPYFILFFYPYFLLFFPLFFSPPHMYPYSFSLFLCYLFFPTTSSIHVPLLFFFISFFRLFPYHFTL